MSLIAMVVYAWLLCLLAAQYVTACERYTFTWRKCHGRRTMYVRSRQTGRVVLHTRNLWDVLSLGIES